eukprot:4255478-Prymnesium_polylepis.1
MEGRPVGILECPLHAVRAMPSGPHPAITQLVEAAVTEVCGCLLHGAPARPIVGHLPGVHSRIEWD